jgi:hypothetical protein|tara:strand:- start:77 stop:709 length:633 start_codon:yes stop_codon:yes gene_type:complete
MGFLDNTSITVDAVLTKKGREKLASGIENFEITHYAFADDEIDYELWDTSHPNGSTYYGAVLDNMPLLEAFVDETQVMRYKLFTSDKDKANLAFLESIASLTIGSTSNKQASLQIEPTTTNGPSEPEKYSFQILNTDIASIKGIDGTIGRFSTDSRTQTVSGASGVDVTINDLSSDTSRTIFQTVVFVTGLQTGATRVVTIKNNSKGTFE